MTTHIDYLADRQQHLSTIAAWHQAEFGYLNPAVTVDERIARLRTSAQRDALPLSLVAVDQGGLPVGAASILPKTLTHDHLGPWLSAVVVPTQYRGQGIASALSLRAAAEARRLGFDTLYLFTPNNASLYQRIGWTSLEHSLLAGRRVTIMARSTSR